MSTLADLLAAKKPYIHTVSPSAMVMDAIRRMNLHRIGALIVLQDSQIVGILTERDILRRVTAQLRSPREVPVQDVMTSTVICGSPTTSIDEARRIMNERRIRHLPIIDATGELHGLISIGDIDAFSNFTHEHTISSLTEFIYGRA